MLTVQRVAQIFGIVFLLVGAIGLFSMNGMAMHSDPTAMILGLFPVNLLHNVVHLLFGVWGLMAARTFAGAQTYAKVGGIIYIVLAVLGWFDATGFGFVPLGGHDIWLHAVLGIVLAYFGFMSKETATA